MKKLLLLVVALFIGFGAMASDELDSKGIALRTGVLKFLKSEGYAPTVDKDGDINFKKEGKNYYVSFQTYGDEYYVETYGLLNTEDSNQTSVLKAANKTQVSLKFVRCDVGNTYVSFGCTQLITSASQYSHTFEDFMRILLTARERILENYSE